MKTTYAKLKSGDWGVRIQGTAQEGDCVTVTKKSGETKQETIEKVLWTGNGVSICAIRQARRGGYNTGYGTRRRRRQDDCDCDCEDCRYGCRCDPHCNCRGGNVYGC